MGFFRLSSFFLILLSYVSLTATPEAVLAKDDTAHLEFQKVATLKAKTRAYVVKKGECLFDILRTQVGITSHRFTIIKKLNPNIKDINKIEPGDTVIIPDMDHPKESGSSTNDYTIRRGDSITRIAIRQLEAKPSDLKNIVNTIKQLNPDIKNYNRIYPGQVIQLPRKSIILTKEESRIAETEASTKVKDELKEKPIVLPEARLAIIGHIISRMNGSLLSSGKYYIPLPQTGQVTVDCATIPIVEFDDGSVILLDFANRIPDTLKNMIKASWKNYHTIEVSNLEDTASILKKIIDQSTTYSMTKNTKPLVVGDNPHTTYSIDWTITKKTSSNIKQYSQGISFITDKFQVLPRPLIAYAERNGLIITQIMDDQTVMTAPHQTYPIPQLTTLNSSTNLEMTNALLILLGYQTFKDNEIRIFNTAKDGFNLSIKSDLLVKQGDKQVVFLPRKIPQQFINTLKNNGTEVVSLDGGETLKSVIRKTLQAMNIPFSFGDFSFSIPEKTDYPKATISFPAFKIARDKDNIYLIEFDIDRDVYGLLHDKWEVTVVKY